ncbi:aldehyde dehydrogenase family protein [Luteimonas huabeiensis]|uniref:aldehyde dehydrogenase family protein n=1 Tax=Luteimonas huabeiensis TaxID=1244513 RepID=UPI0004666493|nr:aldehyde dehydrogenase family protein [Luteimonas huabeiensis]
MDATPHPAAPAATPVDALPATLARLREAWRARKPGLDQREDDLGRLHEALKPRLDEMAAAIAADFGHRCMHESLLADGMTALGELDHARRRLRRWAAPQRVFPGWRLWPARAELRREPLGVVGVISPWNYPVVLALGPLASAIAAGNHVFLKPSEHTPRTSAFLADLLAQVFPPERVAVALGGPEIGRAFSALPFDHLVFTGSTRVGREVMRAAAEHLVPVTLELGGKSPAIVAPDYPLARAARRLATGKWFNAGQTCIAPDYVLIDAARRDALADALRDEVERRYRRDADADYTRIVNERESARLRGWIEEARPRSAGVITLAAPEGERIVPPTLVLDPHDDTALMREEIFGPVLPIKSYRTLEEAIAFVAARPRPLALYPFSDDRATVEQMLAAVLAGGVTVNDTLLHFAASALPFGGVGASGMGQLHGRAGFDALSKPLPVLWQRRWAATDLLKPPYRRLDRLIRRLVR